MNIAHPYKMTLDLSILNHLGLNLYSNIPAVLSEAVANAWDADATAVDILIDRENEVISISDNGCGMTAEEINSKYLKVGYRKRETDGPKTPKLGRHVMGRKGIGKLSLFSIARTIEVHSAKVSCSSAETAVARAGCILQADQIESQIKGDSPDYFPDAVASERIEIEKGTRITISDLRRILTASTETALRKRLARRFSIVGPQYDFSIRVNGHEIGVGDRDYFSKIEYLWTIGDACEEFEKACANAKKKLRLDGVIDASSGFRVSGWVGTFDERKSIEEGNNTISILAWGKLVHEDILSELHEGGVYTKYLMGEIAADYLDSDEHPDITTSDRQHLKEDDPRYHQLLDYIDKVVLRSVENNWRDWRGEDAKEKALENPAVKEWFLSLGRDSQSFAQKLFAKIGTLPIQDELTRKEVYKHAILAFENLKLRDSLSEIELIRDPEDLVRLESVFNEIDDLEAAHYHQIARGRLEVIRAFSSIAEHEKERVIQTYLFDHLWLLHPSWERASTNARIEEKVTKEFEAITAGLTDDERSGRVDIRYKTAAGKHVIIELKKYDVNVTLGALIDQLGKYMSALSKCLANYFPHESKHVEGIAVLGKPPVGIDPAARDRSLAGLNMRIITYDELIQEALESYGEYLEADRKLSRITELLERL